MASPSEIMPANPTTEGFPKASIVIQQNISEPVINLIDIEHMPVTADPRAWSLLRKNITLLLITFAYMISGFSSNIQNPGIQDMTDELGATSAQISLSISIFLLVQGLVPLLWTSCSEIYGRKIIYLLSLSVYMIFSAAIAVSQNIQMVIGFRCLQAAGSAAVTSIGAATLADIFDPHERGRKMGLYYIANLVGPSLGAVFGGVLTTSFNWRAPFWFLVALSGICLAGFVILFEDTFRVERTPEYQKVLRKIITANAMKMIPTEVENLQHDIEKQEVTCLPSTAIPIVKLTFRDVNPLKVLPMVLRRVNNIIILFASAIYSAFSYTVVYTTSLTLGDYYGYDALKIGLVLIAYGVGSIAGTMIGGRYSDSKLTRLKDQNPGRVIHSECRLRCTFICIWLFPIAVIGLGWVTEKRLHIAVVCLMLALTGFFSIWVYTNILTYMVDANVGRSSTAVALNALFRGLAAFTGTEAIVPVQATLGDGWCFTIFAGVLALAGLLIILVEKKGAHWRLAAIAREEGNEFHPEAETVVNTPARAASPTLDKS